jgi:AcrR family transcriptional regulator
MSSSAAESTPAPASPNAAIPTLAPASAAKIRILEAAHNLMLQGAPRASMAEIAQAAGISRQAVYMHYGTREALLTALNQHLCDHFGVAEELQRIAASATGIEALRASASFQARLYPKVWAVVRALETAQGNNDEDAERVWQAQLRNDLAGCKITVERLEREKLLKPELDVDTATDLLWALTSIPLWEELVLQRNWSAQRYEQHVANLLIAALIDSAVINSTKSR